MTPRLPSYLRAIVRHVLAKLQEGPNFSGPQHRSPRTYESEVRRWIESKLLVDVEFRPREGGRMEPYNLQSLLSADRRLPETISDALLLVLGQLRTGVVLSDEDATSHLSARSAVMRWVNRDVLPSLETVHAWAQGEKL